MAAGDQAMGGAPPRSAQERRRVYVRRRTSAVCVVVLALAWVAGLGPGSPPKPARQATAAHAVTLGNSTIAAIAAEDVREHQAIASVLKYTPWVSAGGAAKHEIALTFDDGPGPFTPDVLRELVRLHVPATFFEIGIETKWFGSVIPSQLEHGYVIGDHTENHLPMATLSTRDQRSQLLQEAAAIGRFGAPFPVMFRPPYGSYDAQTFAVAKKLGMLTILWTVDTSDYRLPGTDAIVQSAVQGARNGAIILMHDAGGQRQETIAAIPRIVRALRARGYMLVTVPRLMADDPPSAAQVQAAPALAGG